MVRRVSPNPLICVAELGQADAIAAVHVETWRAAYSGVLPPHVLDGVSVQRRADGWREIPYSLPEPALLDTHPSVLLVLTGGSSCRRATGSVEDCRRACPCRRGWLGAAWWVVGLAGHVSGTPSAGVFGCDRLAQPRA